MKQLRSTSKCLYLARNLSLRLTINTLGNSKPNCRLRRSKTGPLTLVCPGGGLSMRGFVPAAVSLATCHCQWVLPCVAECLARRQQVTTIRGGCFSLIIILISQSSATRACVRAPDNYCVFLRTARGRAAPGLAGPTRHQRGRGVRAGRAAASPSPSPAESVVRGLCDCMWVSFDPRERSICGLATVVGGRGAMVDSLRSPAQLLQPSLAFLF